MKNRMALALEWLGRAESDLKYARAGEKETSMHHVTCYLCHQSVEKSLKGLAVMAGETPPKTHNLSLLASRAAGSYSAVAPLKRDIKKLDKFYVPARYPDGIDFNFQPADAASALGVAEKVLALAERLVGENGRE
jgi:HEPN domain-containing protein